MTFEEKLNSMISVLQAKFPKATVEAGKFEEPSVAPFVWVFMLPGANKRSESGELISDDRRAHVQVFCGVEVTTEPCRDIINALNMAEDAIDAISESHTIVFKDDDKIKFDGVYRDASVAVIEFTTYYNRTND